MKVLQPAGWPRPKGYSNGISASGRMIVTAGVVGWDEKESFPDYRLDGQFAQALRNTLAILAEDGAGPEHIVRMTCYVTDRAEYLSQRDEIGAYWREIMGSNYPAIALVVVKELVEAAAKVEIETTAGNHGVLRPSPGRNICSRQTKTEPQHRLCWTKQGLSMAQSRHTLWGFGLTCWAVTGHRVMPLVDHGASGTDT